MVVPFTHPLAPPLKQVCLLRSILILFERGKELERGLSPLSSKLPFPAINACSFVPVILAGEGSGVNYQPNANRTKLSGPLSRRGKNAIITMDIVNQTIIRVEERLKT